MSQGLELAFPQRHTHGRQKYEKMLNITNHQGNTNTQLDVTSHLSE